jgi:hypothetical protein
VVADRNRAALIVSLASVRQRAGDRAKTPAADTVWFAWVAARVPTIGV